MCNCNETNLNTDCNCLKKTLNLILKLQCLDQSIDLDEGCEKPFLGPCPSITCYNTRPVRFYTCMSGSLWELPFTLGSQTGTTCVFRVENVDGCCCTCRLLAPIEDAENPVSPFVATDSFCTFNLNCIGAMNCLPDVFVPCL